MINWFTIGARGGTFGWGTALQARRSRVQFPMVSLEVFIDIILSVALWPWGRLSLQQKWVPGVFPGGLRRPVRRADNLTTFMSRLSRNLLASTSWNPKGLSRLALPLPESLLASQCKRNALTRTLPTRWRQSLNWIITCAAESRLCQWISVRIGCIQRQRLFCPFMRAQAERILRTQLIVIPTTHTSVLELLS
jgi:hypothetical protein